MNAEHGVAPETDFSDWLPVDRLGASFRRDPSLPEPKRLDRVDAVTTGAFDLERTARIALGRYWKAAAEAQRRERNEDSKALREPWPLDSWPATPTRYLLCRDDRMFTAAWARRHARARLGIEADEMDGGHYITLSRPRELAERLHAHAVSLA